MALSFSLFPWLVVLCALTLSLKLLLKFKNNGSNSRQQLPPGPPGLPLVGNLFNLSDVPHQTFHKLQAKYGPVVCLRIGTINTMVVQSVEAAAELFKKCDVSFADRKVPDSLTVFDFHKGSLGIGSYRDYWRRVRRICTVELLVHKRINASMSIRKKSMEGMIERIKEEAARSGEIQVKVVLFLTAFNSIGNMMVSREAMASRPDRASDFYDAFAQHLEWFGKPNLADYLPILKWMDPQGIRRNTKKYMERLIGIASEIVKERIQEKQSGKERPTRDLLDALLDDEDDANVEGSDKLTMKNIVFVLLDMFFAGTETSSGTIEWGMSALLRHPTSMKKIQDEIDRVVGRARIVEENDLNDLPYLQATVKEILRLYPSIPLMLPRRAIQDTEFMGYLVPENTQIFVNAWAIHRDPNFWPDPLSFNPDRFLDSDIDFKGQHFQMLPFGSGRRSCVGMTLGHRMVTLSLACLLQAFDWKLPDGMKPEELDMREIMGVSLRKLVPLKAIPTLRE